MARGKEPAAPSNYTNGPGSVSSLTGTSQGIESYMGKTSTFITLTVYFAGNNNNNLASITIQNTSADIFMQI